MGRRMLLDGQLNLRTSSQQTPRWRFSSGRCVTVLWTGLGSAVAGGAGGSAEARPDGTNGQ
eukprot:CAMPEP_0178462736 /NCGR_PEP_ID=MMETSP0689_2-20121128/49975_1 /TAXON_ID=160604 /ORGANISM="Amphidinium massartii, Strain CS-259" /LENGTH=60 /DNA_ID=CAMNT_0020089605 /DNA_START=380 /DNA_END=562 /DNA_ORIENTATION=+